MYTLYSRIILIFFILNMSLLFCTKKNLTTWYLYNTLGMILPLLMLALTLKKEKKDKWIGIKIVIFLIVSIIFVVIILGSLIFEDFLKLL